MTLSRLKEKISKLVRSQLPEFVSNDYSLFVSFIEAYYRFLEQDQQAIEIVQNWRYSPTDKISLEYGKLLKSEDKFDEALNVLKRITSKLNADWRSVYRSFHLISLIYFELGKKIEAEKYKKLCLKCNYKYPIVF